MDPDNVLFETAVVEFQQSVLNLEQKMTSIVGNALSDATTPLNAHRVILLLGSFLNRPAMKQKVKESYPRIVNLALKDLSACSDMLKSLPAAGSTDSVVCSVRQIQQISKRARGHIGAIRAIGIGNDVQGMRSLMEKFKRMESVVKVKTVQHVELWTSHMQLIVIQRPLFVLDETSGRLRSGADRPMARMVCECRHLHVMLDPIAIPVAWKKWSSMYDSLKTKMKMVDIIVSCSSSVETSITDSTRNLLQPRLLELKKEAVEPSQNGGPWSWSSSEPDTADEIRKLAETALRLHHCMKKLSSTAESIQQISSSWSKVPLVEFQEGLLPTGEQLTEILTKRYAEYSATSKRIGVIVGEAQLLMPDSQPSDWSTYLKMIDGLILDEILKAIINTYNHFIEQGTRGFLYELPLNITSEGRNIT